MAVVKTCSLTKNLVKLTEVPPKPVVTWDMHEKIRRNKEIWDNPASIVHRLPAHYKKRYWKDFVLARRTPVHYDIPLYRFYWDTKRQVELETEEFPILPEHCPEQDQGLWGGEGVIKGYKESRPYTKKKILPRHWVPKFWFPWLRVCVFYSEILDVHLEIKVTNRVGRTIDKCYGLDLYLLETPDIDIDSRLGIHLKRLLLVKLAKQDYYPDDPEQREYVKAKYARFVLPLEEAEWYGLDLNEACRKQQDLEENTMPRPLKYIFEEQLRKELEGTGIQKIAENKDKNTPITYSF